MTDAPERIWAVIGYAKGTDIRGEFASSVTSFWRDQKPVSYILATPDALASSPEVAALIAEARREAEAMTDGLVKASAWVSVAAEVLAGYNRDLGVDLPDTTEIGRIYESRDTPSFRITVGHIRILAAAIRALKEETP